MSRDNKKQNKNNYSKMSTKILFFTFVFKSFLVLFFGLLSPKKFSLNHPPGKKMRDEKRKCRAKKKRNEGCENKTKIKKKKAQDS